MNQNIIIKPVISEKSMKDVDNRIYTFEVSLKANKFEIVKEIERLFQVKVIQITSVIRKGKLKRVGKLKKQVVMPSKKIVRAKLIEGQKIGIFESANEK